MSSGRRCMSETPSGREWRFYIDDMLGFVERVLEYSGDLDQAGFEESAITYDATLRNLELIGEAATRIPQSVRDESPDIPWRPIIAAEPSDSGLPRHRQRHPLEHHP